MGNLAARAADENKPLKVFILAGQSNMEGQAVVDLDGKNYNEGKGTLKFLFNDPEKQKMVKHLKDDSNGWKVRNDVWVRYQREKALSLLGHWALDLASMAESTTSDPNYNSAISLVMLFPTKCS